MKHLKALFAVIAVVLIGACQQPERQRLVSNNIDTLLNEEYVTADEYEEDIARIRSEVDIKIDSLKKMMDENTTFEDDRFHMIVGSFRVPSNAQGYKEKMKSRGYDAKIINNPNGLRMVSVKSYNNLRNAVTEIERFRQELNVPAWVYVTA
jgi:hypothetical protein